MPEIMESIAPLAWLRALLFIVVGFVIARLASRFFRRVSEKKLSTHHQLLGSMLVFYLLFIIFLLSGLRELGFSMSVLLGAAGVLSVAVGFASQTSASNLISGLFLIAEKPFEIGDVLKLSEFTGEVIAIDLLSIKLKTFDNLMIRVPNETLIKTTFVNMSRYPIRRVDLVIGIAYNEDIERARQVLLAAVQNHPRALESPDPFCIVTLFNASSVDLQLSVWVVRSELREGRSELLVACKEALDKANIEIPYPHTSLYVGNHTRPLPIQMVTEEPPVRGD
ncbi:mechanosensitive ion channel family protein [Neptuniibacter halophilus]|uniref:mechanosensitive ion channel family protein n=1 Tax=Neptuniibacter halophilus TaxID=651666 RepID=UPI0025728BAC|nr:mechanosensitive ion channel family protein [Neptuniibacter halophilus]